MINKFVAVLGISSLCLPAESSQARSVSEDFDSQERSSLMIRPVVFNIGTKAGRAAQKARWKAERAERKLTRSYRKMAKRMGVDFTEFMRGIEMARFSMSTSESVATELPKLTRVVQLPIAGQRIIRRAVAVHVSPAEITGLTPTPVVQEATQDKPISLQEAVLQEMTRETPTPQPIIQKSVWFSPKSIEFPKAPIIAPTGVKTEEQSGKSIEFSKDLSSSEGSQSVRISGKIVTPPTGRSPNLPRQEMNKTTTTAPSPIRIRGKVFQPSSSDGGAPINNWKIHSALFKASQEDSQKSEEFRPSSTIITTTTAPTSPIRIRGKEFRPTRSEGSELVEDRKAYSVPIKMSQRQSQKFEEREASLRVPAILQQAIPDLEKLIALGENIHFSEAEYETTRVIKWLGFLNEAVTGQDFTEEPLTTQLVSLKSSIQTFKPSPQLAFMKESEYKTHVGGLQYWTEKLLENLPASVRLSASIQRLVPDVDQLLALEDKIYSPSVELEMASIRGWSRVLERHLTGKVLETENIRDHLEVLKFYAQNHKPSPEEAIIQEKNTKNSIGHIQKWARALLAKFTF